MDFLEETYADIRRLAAETVELCSGRGIRISSAESCTGGMISAAVTAISGSSAVIELGICSYSNRIKNELLGVSRETLERFSEYSAECAAEMARGAKRASGADYGVSTTGVAGPSGGTEDHPVGEVCIAVCGRSSERAERFVFLTPEGKTADRDYIRAQAARTALSLLLEQIKKENT